MSDLPMMPFWVKDWLSAVMHWPCAERGAYISLLAFQWCNGHVPRDVPQLARIVGSNEEEFEHLWQTIGPKFDDEEEGLVNRRLEEHRNEATRLREAHSRGARRANQTRRAKRAARDGSTDVPRLDAQCTPPSPSPSSSQEEEKTQQKNLRARSARAQRVSRGTDFYDEKFLTFKLEMPDREGGHGWHSTQKAWNARLDEGYTEQQMIEGATRYKRYADACIREKRYVMQAKKFLGPDKWFLQMWDVSANDEHWSPPSDDASEVA